MHPLRGLIESLTAWRGTAAVGLAVLLCACVPEAYYTSPNLERGDETHRVVLMPVDIELSLLHAGGALEPNAEWTELARGHVRAALYSELAEVDARLIYAEEIDAFGDLDRKQVQLIKLNEALGLSILRFHYDPLTKLPTKADNFDWTLGPEARILRDKFGADYALFVLLRDSYSSSGRVLVSIIGALLGAPIQGGTQTGFASLVDLHSGEVVWFNRLARGTGDLRTQEAAAESVDLLLKSFPQ